MDVLSFLVGWFVLAIFTAAIAVSKSRSAIGWFILSAFFPILALIAVGLMPSLKEDADKPTPKTHVKCPDCRELVVRAARKCKHCGTSLIPNASND